MKKFLFLLLMLVPMVAGAYDAKIDGIYYNFDSEAKTAEVTNETGRSDARSYSGIVNIPASVEYNGVTYSVTSIGDEAFSGCSSLTSVTIPNSVRSIGSSAFSGCSGLTSMTIPNSVTSIETAAFERCKGLTSVTIPNSVTSIGEGAFSECKGLTSVTIPNSVTSIGDRAFQDCRGLTSIVVDKNNKTYDSRENCNAIIETSTNTLIAGCKNTTIPNSVTSIGDWAFSGCSSLTSVTIPTSVTSIGDRAFSGCSGLTSVTIPNSVTSIGWTAFNGCSSLTSVTIPNSVTSIGYEAFSDCSGLTSVTIPNSVTSIEDRAFQNCSGLTSIVVDNNNKTYDSRENCNAIIETSTNTLIAGCMNTTIPNSVTSIGEYAFEYCRGLTSVTIPNSVTSIGAKAFYGCSSIRTIHSQAKVPPTVGTYCFEGLRTNDVELYVPLGTKEDYAAAEGWNAFRNIIEESEGSEEGEGSELEKLQAAYNQLQADNDQLKSDNTALEKEVEEKEATIKQLRGELALYMLGDLNQDGRTDIDDVVVLITLSQYSSDSDALATLTDATSITVAEIGEKWGDVEYFTLDGKKVSEPTERGIYVVKKDGQTKMIVVKK